MKQNITTLPLKTKTELFKWLQQQLCIGEERARNKDTDSIFVPLFQLKVPPRFGRPPICPGPYAPAYPASTPHKYYKIILYNYIK